MLAIWQILHIGVFLWKIKKGSANISHFGQYNMGLLDALTFQRCIDNDNFGLQ